VPREEVDRDLPAKLKAEASGILNRLLEGLCDWKEHGLIEPDQVRMATEAYRDQSDELGRFLHDVCEVGEDMPQRPMRVAAKLLHDTYLAWCDQAGGAFWKIGGFKKAMLDKGFASKASDGMKWLGVRLRDGIDPDAIREGRWSGPDAPAGSGGAQKAESHHEWPTGDDADWMPGD
jgi:putative DNA primase/helicase